MSIVVIPNQPINIEPYTPDPCNLGDRKAYCTLLNVGDPLFWQAKQTPCGDSLISDGTFIIDVDSPAYPWVAGTNWSIGTGIACHSPGVASVLSQETLFDPDADSGYYQITFEVSDMTDGVLSVNFDSDTAQTITANGIYTLYFTVTGITPTTIYFSADSDFDGCLTDIAGYEIRKSFIVELKDLDDVLISDISAYLTYDQDFVTLSIDSISDIAMTNGNCYKICVTDACDVIEEEFVLNGDFYYGVTNWTRYDTGNTSLSITGNKIVCTNVNTHDNAYVNEFSLDPTKKHVVRLNRTITSSGAGTGTCTLTVNTTGGHVTLDLENETGDYIHVIEPTDWVAGAGSFSLYGLADPTYGVMLRAVGVNGDTNYTVDNISIREQTLCDLQLTEMVEDGGFDLALAPSGIEGTNPWLFYEDINWPGVTTLTTTGQILSSAIDPLGFGYAYVNQDLVLDRTKTYILSFDAAIEHEGDLGFEDTMGLSLTSDDGIVYFPITSYIGSNEIIVTPADWVNGAGLAIGLTIAVAPATTGDNWRYTVDNVSLIEETCVTPPEYCSPCISVSTSHDCAKQVEGIESGNKLGFNFDADFRLIQRLRVLKFNPEYNIEDETYDYSNGASALHYGARKKYYSASFDYMGETEHDTVSAQMLCSNFQIDAQRYTVKQEDYKPEWAKEGGQRLAQSRLIISKYGTNIKNSNA